jgi:predicted DNA binding protein
MRRIVIEISSEDMLSRDSESKFLKVDSLELVHFLRQERESVEGIVKIVFKDPSTKIEEIFPSERAKTQLLSEDRKSGSRIYFFKARLRRNSPRYLFRLGTSSLGYVTLPFEIKDQKVRMSFLGNSKDIRGFLKRLKRSYPNYKLLSLTDANFSVTSPLNHLTYKQQRVLLAAFNLGYYETPRRISSMDLAKKLNIDSSTLIVHRRKAEQRVMAQIINGENSDRFLK